MDNASGHTINLANSIIGVSILAMPYCFRQCGIILSILLLLISSIISRLACHFLLKSAIIARRKTFEFLAFHIFGSLGKFLVEIGMIGFLLGTCIAFFVVMGDLGPEILSEMTGVHVGNGLRNSTLIVLAVFCVLPLGLLRNVDSLNSVSTATIGFYGCLVLKIVVEALPHLVMGDWVDDIVLWRPDGILQCLPIFSMALFCQTQLFEIYQVIPNASLEKMNSMVRVALNMGTWVYIFVGTFGYIAFFQKQFTGNILLSFNPSAMSDIIKMGFVLSLAFSFPLVIFPCRASLYSLLYKGASYTNLHDGSATNFIPEGKFKMLTLIIVLVSLVIGLMIPSVELVLGLIGSTIGVMICVLFPVTCFICISPKNTNERLLAQIMLFVGVIVMVLGTYANLQAIEYANMNVITEKVPENVNLLKLEPEKPLVMIPTTVKPLVSEEKKQTPPNDLLKIEPLLANVVKNEESPKEVRHEPPQPEEPVENVEVKTEKPNKVEESAIEKLEVKETKQVLPIDDNIKDQVAKDEEIQKPLDVESKQEKKIDAETNQENKRDEVDVEAIKKEEAELKDVEDKQEKERNQVLIDTLKKQNEVQKEMVEQQKKLIEVIQRHQDEHVDVEKVNEEKVKAVKQIEDIAKRAIESISGNDKKPNVNEDNTKNKENVIPPLEEKASLALNSVESEKEKKQEDAQRIETVDLENKVLSPQENLGSKINISNISMIPLPLALANLNKSSAVKTDRLPADEAAKAMRRDILSEINSKTRTKREVKEIKMENLHKAVKEVCDEVNKSPSTEKPIIKMLCKLSEPELVESHAKIFETENLLVDLKGEKRDLK